MNNILLIYSGLIPSVRLCALEMLEYLYKNGKINFKHSNVYKCNSKLLNWAHIVIIVRGADEVELSIIKACKKAEKYLIYVLDDDLLGIPSTNLNSSYFYNNEKIKDNIVNIIKMCNMLWTPNPNIIDKYGCCFESVLLIDEPAIKCDFKSRWKDKVKIGFAGSIDHESYIDELIGNVIKKLNHKYGDNIIFEFFGARPKIVSELGLSYIQYTNNYDEYKEILKSLNWDIGLAPLIDSPFHKCKYFNKYIEYGSLGIIGVYSNVEPYTFIINGENGLLSNNNDDDWINNLSKLIENKELRKSILVNVISEMENRFSVSTISDSILSSFNRVERSESDQKVKGIGLIIVKHLIKKTLYFIKKHKHKTLIKLYQKLISQN